MMKNLILKAFIFLFLVGFTGCKKTQQQDKQVLSLNPREAVQSQPLSTFVESISYIPLETSNESLMVRVSEIIIKDTYIYAVDSEQKMVFIFDKNGKFVSKLARRGEGPDEYLSMQQVLVDDAETFITVFDYRGDNSRTISYDVHTLEPIVKHPLFIPSGSTVRKEKERNIYYFAAQQQENTVNGEITNADIIAVGENNTQKALFKKNIVTGGSMFGPFAENFTKTEDDEIIVSLMYNNTFFKLSNMEAQPVLTVDFGKHNMDSAIGLKSTVEQMDFLYSDERSEGLAYFPVLNTYNSDLLAFTYYFKENSKINIYHYLDLKSGNRKFHVRDIENDLTGFPDKVFICSFSYSIRHEVYRDGYLVDVFFPADQIKEKSADIPGLGKVDREDNPIIVLMKIREVK
jgi:hypothetical protein